MPRFTKKSAFALLSPSLPVLALFASSCTPAEPPSSSDDSSHAHAVGSLSLWAHSSDHAVFVDYAPAVGGEQSRFAVHLTRSATGAAVTSADVELVVLAAGNAVQRIPASTETQPGHYSLAAFLPTGKYELRLRAEPSDLQPLDLGAFEVYADASAADAALHDFEHELPSDLVHFGQEQQWNVGLRTATVERRTVAERIDVPAKVVIPSHAQAIVRAPFDGVLGLPAGAAFPHLGQVVKRGEVVGEVKLVLSPADRAAVEANTLSRHEHEKEIQLREFDLRVRELEAQQAAALAESRLEFAASELSRLDQLNQSGLVKQDEYLRAQANQRAAELSHEAANALLVSLAEVRQDLVALHDEELPFANNGQVAQLTAPIDGVVVEMNFGLGEQVPASAAAMRIVDPTARWIELQVPETLWQHFGDQSSVKLALPGQGEYYDLNRDWGGSEVFRSPRIDAATRSLSIFFSCPDSPQLPEGSRLHAQLAISEVEQAWAIPQSAVVDESGIAVVFVARTGELFEKRPIQLGVRDGDTVQVLTGLREGERVVTHGAYLVRLAASSSDSFGHGHVH